MDIYTKDAQGNLIFSPAFFQHCMAKALQDPQLKVLSDHYDLAVGVTDTTKMKYAGEQKKLLGLFEYEVEYQSKTGVKTVNLLVKSKTNYQELLKKLAHALIQAGLKLNEETLINFLAKTALYFTHLKEIETYELALKKPAFGKFIPPVYGTYIDETTETYIVLEEFLKDAYVIKDYRDISFWDKNKILAAVRDLSHLHAVHYQNYADIVTAGWLGFVMDTKRMLELRPLWTAYAENMHSYEGNLFTKEDLEFQFDLIKTLPEWWSKIESMSRTLIYNDLQIRNLAMQPLGNDDWRLYLYDWECVTVHLPQRDLVELLSYVISEDVTDADLEDFFEMGRNELAKASKKKIDKKQWLEGCLYSVYDYRVNRMAVQLVLSKAIFRTDIARVFQSSKRLMQFLNKALER